MKLFLSIFKSLLFLFFSAAEFILKIAMDLANVLKSFFERR